MVSGEPLKTEHIKSEWNFTCHCTRCSNQDPISEIICFICQKAPLVYPVGIEKLTEPWKCINCNAEISAQDIKNTVTLYQDKLKYVFIFICDGFELKKFRYEPQL